MENIMKAGNKQETLDQKITQNPTKDLEKLFDECVLNSEFLNSDSISSEELAKKLENIDEAIKTCTEKIEQFCGQIQELKATDSVIRELSSRCKQLAEQFYETEVLYPVLFCMIGIADRCHQQINKLQELIDKYTESNNESAITAIKYLVEARKADLAEIENTLANYGIEPYQNDKQSFDATAQKCVQKTPCENQSQNGLICQRLLPGYKRHEKIIRKEYVTVFTNLS